jgi:phage terminase large subunit GpA-like protein
VSLRFDRKSPKDFDDAHTRGFPRREWVKVRPRNEALDCRVYAMAALYILNPAWNVFAKRRAVVQKQPEKPKPAVSQDPPFLKRRKGSYASRWRDDWRRGLGRRPPWW